MMKKNRSLYRISVSALTLFFVTASLLAQNSAADIYFQDRITAMVKAGYELIEAQENKEGLSYLQDAIRIAAERRHDYYATAILVNQSVFDPLINHYYSVDSTALARHYIDLYATLYMRFPDAKNANKEFTEEEYSDYLLDCYSTSAAFAQANKDHPYAIKYLKLYIEASKAYSRKTKEYYPILGNLMWEYLDDGQYINALSYSIKVFEEKKDAGLSDEEAIEMAFYSFSWVNMECRKNPAILQTAKEACDIWISFLKPLYEERGRSYMDSLLLKLDGNSSLRDEIINDLTSTSMVASMMNRCWYAIELDGFDNSKNLLFDFREELYNTEQSDLWPIACLRFIYNLENRKMHSATYSFCQSIEEDFSSRTNISQDDLLFYYIHYAGACEKCGDLLRASLICFIQLGFVKESDDYYWFVSRLKGSACLEWGQYEEGLSYMLAALEHYKWPVEPMVTDAILYASLNAFVGQAYRQVGKPKEAIEYCQKSISICDQFGLPNNKYFPLLELGRNYMNEGALERARDCFISCSEIQLETNAQYGVSGPLSYLFDIERQLGNTEKARYYLREAWSTQLNEYLSFRDYLTVQQQTQYWTENVDISFISGLAAESSPSYNDILYDILLTSKGFLLKAEAAEYNNVFGSGDSRLIDLYLSTHSGNKPNLQVTDKYMALYRSHMFKSELENASWKTVLAALSKNDIAIEFFQYETKDKESGKQYGALILKAGWKTPKFVHLCSSANLERVMRAKHRAYSIDGHLYSLIWEPIIKELKGVNSIYYAPQGLLHTINLDAITNNKGVPMFQAYSMHRLSTTVNIKGGDDPPIKKSYVYGGLVYDTDDETMLQEHRKFNDIINAYAGLSWVADSTSSRHGWAYLPNSKTETDLITNLLAASKIKVVKYSGVEGTEESFKALDGTRPGHIHLATHGFYLHYSYSDSTAIADNYEKQIASSLNPLIRTGLILSNGGRAWKGESIPRGVEDGILQADEIARINLSGTSLLVLSACETALGDISSDGVYGLQRAFKMAGVETIIMSLWEVDDKATALFMSFFYEALTSGKKKHEAFVSAQNQLREKYSDPYYWAAFIMLD